MINLREAPDLDMMNNDDIEEVKEKRLCFNCVGEAFLRKVIQANGVRKKCSYCNKLGKSYSIEVMAEEIESVFDEHYIRTSDQPSSYQYSLLADKESDYDWERDGENVVYTIMNAAEISEEAATDIQMLLASKFEDFDSAAMGEETEFSSDSHYEAKGVDDSNWQIKWRQLEASLKSQSRFFNHALAEHLATIFDGIDAMSAWDGRSLIVDAGPTSSLPALYRARVFQSNEKLAEALQKPDQHIGPPPSAHANAGRMNAKGVSVFYGANDPEVALAEVRPPVGSQVVVACFEILRPLRLLDLTALEKVTVKGGSVFDPAFSHHLERAMFLRSLSSRITKPVMPDDEAFEYLITQAIADFLVNGGAVNIDGIIFPSVQADGKALNVVLFHKSAKVKEIVLPPGAEVRASLDRMGEDGWETEYSVTEVVPPEEDKPENSELDPPNFDCTKLCDDSDNFDREVTLQIDLKSLKVHIVKAVEFTTDKHLVFRHRWEKRTDMGSASQ